MHLPPLRGRLSRDESMVLVTLARALVRADGHISDHELDAMLALAHEVGLDVFADALERPESPRLTDSDLRQMAARVRTESQEVVLHALFELGLSDGLVEPERRLLARLATIWGLDEPTVT